jgi:hypothetical protein
LTKYGLGYILVDFLTNSSGHPVSSHQPLTGRQKNLSIDRRQKVWTDGQKDWERKRQRHKWTEEETVQWQNVARQNVALIT